MTGRPMWWRAAFALILLVGCSADGDPSQQTRPVTQDEADLIASALFLNHDLGSASYELNAQLENGASYQMSGEINWSPLGGRADIVALNTPDSVVVEAVWAGDEIAERIPELTQLVESADMPASAWFSRAASPESVQLDALIRIVTGLASDTRENPQLLRQNGALWIRSDNLRGLDVEVFAVGDRSRLWIDADGRVIRFEGNNSERTRPVVVDLSDHGSIEVLGPPEQEVLPRSAVEDLYLSVVRR